MENTLKQKLAAGAQPIGTFFDTASVSLMECLGRTGLDFAIIDNEHSPICLLYTSRRLETKLITKLLTFRVR